MSNDTYVLNDFKIGSAFLYACRAEVQALKPGNVHIHAPGHDMTTRQFYDAADAAVDFIADPTLRVGARIKKAVTASLEAAGCNTNLGIILLCAPLAAAFDQESEQQDARQRLNAVLSNLNAQDAKDVFAAIQLANPGGLGTVDTLDVHDPSAASDLVKAMRLAAPVDRIARAYSDGFNDIFSHHLPNLYHALELHRSMGVTDPNAITMLHMQILQDFPDSHIGRKFGGKTAKDVQRQAAELRPMWRPDEGGFWLAEKNPHLLAFDRKLKDQGFNPGTTADFVVATLYTAVLSSHLAALTHTKV